MGECNLPTISNYVQCAGRRPKLGRVERGPLDAGVLQALTSEFGDAVARVPTTREVSWWYQGDDTILFGKQGLL